MPRNSTTGAEALGLTEDVTGLDIDGVDAVPQGKSKFANTVIDFTKIPDPLIPDGTQCTLEIKQARPAMTPWGDPQVSILVQVDGGDFDGMAFWDAFDFAPAKPPSKGKMWRVHQYCEAVNYELPTSVAGDEIMPFLKQFAEDSLGESFDAVVSIYQSNKVSQKTGELPKPRNTIKRFIKPGTRSIDDLLLG